MKNIKQILLLAVVSLIAISCDKGLDPVVGGEFTTMSEIGIYDDTNVIFEYDSEQHQTVVNSTGLLYRIQNDTQSEYINIELSSSETSVGSSQSVVLTVSGISGVSSGTYTMEVLKSSGSNVWLWDEAKSVGVLIPSSL